jgi:hypothetical protein
MYRLLLLFALGVALPLLRLSAQLRLLRTATRPDTHAHARAHTHRLSEAAVSCPVWKELCAHLRLAPCTILRLAQLALGLGRTRTRLGLPEHMIGDQRW